MVVLPDHRPDYTVKGFYVARKLLSKKNISEAAAAAEPMFSNFSGHAVARKVCYDPATLLGGMIRIDYPHLISSNIYRLITSPELGRAAADLTGATAIQVWYCHMIRKPQATNQSGNVGWHQDGQYTPFFRGHFVSAWIPLTPVCNDSSPLCYLVGSHRFGVIGGSGFSHTADMETMQRRMQKRKDFAWVEHNVTADPGDVSFHDSLTVHGSRSNTANKPRISITVHMRTNFNKIDPVYPGGLDIQHLGDPAISPVILGSISDLDFG